MATYLVARTADDYMPAYYVMAAALISFSALLGLPETAGKSRTTADPRMKARATGASR